LREAPTLYSIHAEIAAPAESVRAPIGRWAEVNPLSASGVQSRSGQNRWIGRFWLWEWQVLTSG
jgi:hypothetical protein